MYFLFCNVKTNLFRYFKTLVITTIFFIIACGLLLTFTSIKLFIDDIKSDYQKIVTISVNKNLVEDENIDKIVAPSQGVLETISKNKDVQAMSQTSEVYISAPDLIFPEQKIMIDPYFFLVNQSYIKRPSDFKLLAYNEYAMLEMMSTLELNIVEGTMLDKLDEVLVSREFVELNNLSVGDVVTLNSIFSEYSFDVKISGVYDSNQDIEIPVMLTSIDAVLSEISPDFLQVNTSFVLKNSLSYEDFTRYANEQLSSDSYIAEYDKVSYDKVTAPLKARANHVKNVSATWIVIGCFSIFMYLLYIRKSKVIQFTYLRLNGFTMRKIVMIVAVELGVMIFLAMFLALGFICVIILPLIQESVMGYNLNLEQSIIEASQIIGFSFEHSIDFGSLRDYWFGVVVLYMVVFVTAFTAYVNYIVRFELSECILGENDDTKN